MQSPQEHDPKPTKKEPEVDETVALSSPMETGNTDVAQQVGTQLKAEEDAKKKQVSVQSEYVDALLKAFQDKFGNDEWYKKNKPKVEDDGSISMQFKSHEDLVSFSQEQAKAGVGFVMIDAETNKVLAYSNGLDGKLYNGNGTEYDPKTQKDFIAGPEYTKDFRTPPPTPGTDILQKQESIKDAPEPDEGSDHQAKLS